MCQLKLHELSGSEKMRKKSSRIGSGLGKTSGKGHKDSLPDQEEVKVLDLKVDRPAATQTA